MNNDSKRIVWIDYLRFIAIVCVVLCHVVETTFSLSMDGYFEISSNHNIPLILFALGRIGVPIFLLISGYLLLDRSYSRDKRVDFWKDKVVHLLVIIEIWLVIYFIWNKLYENMPITGENFIRELFFVRSCEMSHMWYMPMILGIYLFIPFVAIVLQQVELKHICIIWSICVIYAFGIPTLNIILNMSQSENAYNILSLEFGGGGYGCYLLAGYLIKKGLLKKVKNIFLIIISCMSFIAVCLLEILAYHKSFGYNAWYDCIFLLILGICLFELFSRIEFRTNRLIQLGAKYSFGVYLTHNIVRSFIMKNIILDNMNKVLVIDIYLVMVVVISYIITIVISKIPKIGKYILYMK